MKIGLAGLGLMGAAIAGRLIDTGHLLTVYNRNSIKTGPFANRGVAVASTPKELAQDSDFILISVTNFIAVKEICFGNEGILACNSNDFIVADTSTISPEESKFCAQSFRDANIAMLGMPVMGGTTAAENGKLVPIICGSREAFEKVAPIIKNIIKSNVLCWRTGWGCQYSQVSIESKYWSNSWSNVRRYYACPRCWN